MFSPCSFPSHSFTRTSLRAGPAAARCYCGCSTAAEAIGIPRKSGQGGVVAALARLPVRRPATPMKVPPKKLFHFVLRRLYGLV
eukprot:1156267-Pelagomonas_calceolata.AAC.1